MELPENVVDDPALRERVRVFRDRAHAGIAVAAVMAAWRPPQPLVLAIPAGGVPVAVALAHRLGLPMDLLVVSKITPPGATEYGYGAVASDGTVQMNEDLLPHLGLSREQVQAGVARTRDKVARRERELRGGAPPLELAGRDVALVDDGLASGITMRVAVHAARAAGAGSIAVAVPTGHLESVRRLAGEVDAVYCANVRAGRPFAVADAYERWSDVSEPELRAALVRGGFRGGTVL